MTQVEALPRRTNRPLARAHPSVVDSRIMKTPSCGGVCGKTSVLGCVRLLVLYGLCVDVMSAAKRSRKGRKSIICESSCTTAICTYNHACVHYTIFGAHLISHLNVTVCTVTVTRQFLFSVSFTLLFHFKNVHVQLHDNVHVHVSSSAPTYSYMNVNTYA